MTYQVNYQDHIKNEIVLTDLKQSPVQDRWCNLKEAKRQLIHCLKKEIKRGEFSLEEQKQIKKRIAEINKMTKKSFNIENKS